MTNLGVRSALRALASDRRYNRLRDSSVESILVLRQTGRHPFYNEHYLDWLRSKHPAIARRFRLAHLTPLPVRLSGVRLVVPWVQDPLREEYPADFRRAQRIEDQCRRRGIDVVNPTARLSIAIKSVALPRIAECGVRTARVIRIDSPEAMESLPERLPFPFLVREDYLHTRHPLVIRNADELRQLRWNRFSHPIALEFIDVRNPDGLYRKYRYFIVGRYGAARHLVVAADWCVHAEDRILSQATLEEELAYVSNPDPNHETLERVARALEFDFTCFDYSYDQEGRLVIWEPNPLPVLWGTFNTPEKHGYQMPVLDRLYSTMTRYYLERARMEDLAEPLRESGNGSS